MVKIPTKGEKNQADDKVNAKATEKFALQALMAWIQGFSDSKPLTIDN
ncbi:MAG TPA: hypothetical protein PKX92_01350 [Edaphocola sp.]|nr:hypothetical protein [Edaphocola sp.]